MPEYGPYETLLLGFSVLLYPRLQHCKNVHPVSQKNDNKEYRTLIPVVTKLRSSKGEQIPHYCTDGRFEYISCTKDVFTTADTNYTPNPPVNCAVTYGKRVELCLSFIHDHSKTVYGGVKV